MQKNHKSQQENDLQKKSTLKTYKTGKEKQEKD